MTWRALFIGPYAAVRAAAERADAERWERDKIALETTAGRDKAAAEADARIKVGRCRLTLG